MAHNFRNEVRKLNLITSTRTNGSVSGRMAQMFRNEVRNITYITSFRTNERSSYGPPTTGFSVKTGNPFFIFNLDVLICKNLKNMIYYIKIIEGGRYVRIAFEQFHFSYVHNF